MPYDVIVIGAGHNGLVAAAYLARAGRSVCVLERSDVIGGATVSEHPWPGWTVSTASYVCSLLHPQIIAELDLHSHGYDAYRKAAASFTPMLDGRSLLLTRDEAASAAEIALFSQRDVDGFRSLEAERERLGGLVFDALNHATPSFGRFDDATQATLRGSAADLVRRFIQTPVLAAESVNDGLIGTYAGPESAGTAYVLAHHNAGKAFGVQGAWGFVRGGMGAVAAAIASAARSAGAEIRCAARVGHVVVRSGAACGVALEDGTELQARAVLSNADPKTTFLHLTPSGELDDAFVARVDAWSCTGVALKVNLALGELPNFTCRPSRTVQPHHSATIHVADSIEYLQSAYEDARAGGVSRAPLIEGYMQSPTDPSIAPPGKHVLSIFAQYFPYDRADGPWTRTKAEEAADVIVASLARFAPNLPNAIEARQILTPLGLEERFGLTGGHIFHGELLPAQIFENRFATRTPLRGLYLCGSGAHPGGCVSGSPGLRASQAVLSDFDNDLM